MATPSVVWSPEALAERDHHYAYIAAHASPARAYAVLRRIVAATEQLAIFPESGRLLPSGHRERAISKLPYVIEYTLHDGTVHIMHVWHASQDRRSAQREAGQ